MFLEIKTEPEDIVIQRKTKRGLWENIAQITMGQRMDYHLVKNIIQVYWDRELDFKDCSTLSEYDVHVRAVIIGRKSGKIIQVMSSDGLDFYDSLEGHQRSYWSLHDKKDGHKWIFTNFEPTIFYTFEDFHQMIIRSGGIKKARMRASDPADDYLKTWDITFNDNSEFSLSFLEAS
jgi:hypothetical protein